MSLPPPSSSSIGAELSTLVIAAGRGVAPETSQVARLSALAGRIHEVDGSERYDLLTAAICSRRPQDALQLLRDTGLLAALLPELDATVGLVQEGARRHKDVWEHTKTVVWQSVPRPAVRWAAVLHDIGKVPTRRFLADGRVTFHGHAQIGERMFEQGPAVRVAFPEPVRARVAELIRWHQRPGQYDGTWSDAAVRRFAREVGPALTDLLDLSRADVTSQRPGRRKACLARISELGRRIRALEAEARRPRSLPPGLGHHLIRGLHLRPGPKLGALRAELERLCERGELEPGREPDYYVEYARAELGALLA